MSTAASRPSLGIIGLGNMGAAIGHGVIRAGLAPPADVVGYDPDASRAAAFEGTSVDLQVCATARTVLLAVKPHIAPTVCAALGPLSDTLVLSVAAGVTIEQLRADGLAETRIVRAMPNTAAALGESTTALYGADDLSVAEARVWLEAVGRVVTLPREELLHAATALVGSGPAFLYALAEAMADAGVHEGLPRTTAQEMVASVFGSTASLLAHAPAAAATLKDAVASPGGTTIAGLRALELAGGRAAVLEAIVAASQRSRALAGES